MTDRPNRLPVRPAEPAQGPGSSSASPGSEHQGMDVLSDVLRCVRLTGAVIFLVDGSPPWITQAPAARTFVQAALPGAQHLISYHIISQGACWAGLSGAQPEYLSAGDILVIPHGHPYFLADPSPGELPACNTEELLAFFRGMAAGALPTVVTAGAGGPPRTHFICGFLGCDTHPFNPVLAALPSVIYLRRTARAEHRLDALIDLAVGELRERGSGSREVLLRLSELLFIAAVRQYLESVHEAQEGWVAGLRDPISSKVLALLHAEPARAWTLENLAARVGASRSVLVDRFTQMMGEPPMRYLTAWRMQRAAGLLADRTSKVRTVAAAVGYDSEAAFSRAFKRFVGMSPNSWRERGR
jgi:AraC-like DNA-binding protein